MLTTFLISEKRKEMLRALDRLLDLAESVEVMGLDDEKVTNSRAMKNFEQKENEYWETIQAEKRRVEEAEGA